MSWAKVTKGRKPAGWWYHKLLCELGWVVRNHINCSLGERVYYEHLNKMVKKYRINLYGDPF